MKELRIIGVPIYRAVFDSPGGKKVIKIRKTVRIVGLSVPSKLLRRVFKIHESKGSCAPRQGV